MKLTYQNPQTIFERAVTSCESKIIDLERRPGNDKRKREIEVQKFLLRATQFYQECTEDLDDRKKVIQEYLDTLSD